MIKVNILRNKVMKQAGKLCAYFSCLSIMCLFSVASYGTNTCQGKYDPEGKLELIYGGFEVCVYNWDKTNSKFTFTSGGSQSKNCPQTLVLKNNAIKLNKDSDNVCVTSVAWRTKDPYYVHYNLQLGLVYPAATNNCANVSASFTGNPENVIKVTVDNVGPGVSIYCNHN